MATNASRMTDEEIREEIEQQLAWDDRVPAERVDVDVRSGIVTLAGQVPTYRARTAAEDSASAVLGVRSVQNELHVEHAAGIPTPVDADVQAGIVQMLHWNPDVDASRITVDVENGKVVLLGEVDTYWKKAYVAELTAGIRGVREIDNRLAVAPSRSVDDEKLAADVEAALDRNLIVDAEDVEVNVHDGVVRLSGTVYTWTARQAAYNVARFTPGVREVHDDLTIDVRPE